MPFHGIIRISDAENAQAKPFEIFLDNKEEMSRIRAMCSKTNYSGIKALTHVIRRGSFSHVVQDLFFPSTVNVIQTVDNIALKLLLMIPAFITDVATLLIRVITLIFCRQKPEDHPLKVEVKKLASDHPILKANQVVVKFESVELRELSEIEKRERAMGSCYSKRSSTASWGPTEKTVTMQSWGDNAVHQVYDKIAIAFVPHPWGPSSAIKKQKKDQSDKMSNEQWMQLINRPSSSPQRLLTSPANPQTV